MNNISLFITKNLARDGKDAIPEIQALRDVVENNPWHKDQSVFEHTKLVVEALKKYTDNELLLLATLFHDIAKPCTFFRDEKTVMTICVDHEKKGSEMMDTIGPRIGLTEKDLSYVKRIIKHHDMPHILVNNIVEQKDVERLKNDYFTKTGNLAQDLLLHARADMEGSSLSEINSELFEKRKKIIEELMSCRT